MTCNGSGTCLATNEPDGTGCNDGTQSTGDVCTASSLKPGSYTVTITRDGYPFPVGDPITGGPSSAGNVFVATPP